MQRNVGRTALRLYRSRIENDFDATQKRVRPIIPISTKIIQRKRE